MTRVNIDNVKAQIKTEGVNDNAVTSKSPGKIDVNEARSIIRSELALGVNLADIRQAVNESTLSAAERKLFTDALRKALPAPGVLAPVELVVISASGSRSQAYLEATAFATKPGHIQITIATARSKPSEGSPMTAEIGTAVFNGLLAQAYGLDPKMLNDDASPENKALAVLLKNPDIAAAALQFNAQLSVGAKLDVTLPTINP